MGMKHVFELRYFQEIWAISSDFDPLRALKVQMIADKEVRYPEGLKIYFDGEEYIFDDSPNLKQASRERAEIVLHGHY